MDLKEYIEDVPDFPKKGIIFKDITPIITDGEAFKYVINEMAKIAKKLKVNKIVGPEARGFIFGCPVANKLKIGFVPVRKPGKLPRETVSIEYDLEYGTNILSIHKDALVESDRVLIIDDLLATGGTTKATVDLVKKLNAKVCGVCCIIELLDLKGKEKIEDIDVYSLVKY